MVLTFFLKNATHCFLQGSTNATSLRWAAITERNWSQKGHLPIEKECLFTCKGCCSLWIHKVVDRDCSCQVGLRLRHHHYFFCQIWFPSRITISQSKVSVYLILKWNACFNVSQCISNKYIIEMKSTTSEKQPFTNATSTFSEGTHMLPMNFALPESKTLFYWLFVFIN